jgi:hypothetical protein
MSTTLELEPAIAIAPPPRRRWRRTLMWSLVSLVIFVCGGVTGHGVTVWMWEKNVQPVPKPSGQFIAKILEKMKEDLVLTDDQTARIDVILQDHHKRNDELKKKFHPYFADERDKMVAAVSSVLDDVQRPKFQQRMRDLERLWTERPPRSPHGTGDRRKDDERRGEETKRGDADRDGGDKRPTESAER